MLKTQDKPIAGAVTAWEGPATVKPHTVQFFSLRLPGRSTDWVLLYGSTLPTDINKSVVLRLEAWQITKETKEVAVGRNKEEKKWKWWSKISLFLKLKAGGASPPQKAMLPLIHSGNRTAVAWCPCGSCTESRVRKVAASRAVELCQLLDSWLGCSPR